jgi:hypothetical protein
MKLGKLTPVVPLPREYHMLRQELPGWEIGVYDMPRWYFPEWGKDRYYLYTAKQGEQAAIAGTPRELIEKVREGKDLLVVPSAPDEPTGGKERLVASSGPKEPTGKVSEPAPAREDAWDEWLKLLLGVLIIIIILVLLFLFRGPGLYHPSPMLTANDTRPVKNPVLCEE